MADHSHSARYPPGRAVTKRTLRYYVQSRRIEHVFGSVLLGLVQAAHEAARDDASALTEAELTEGLVAVTQALSLLETTQAHLVVQLDTCATCEREHGLSVGSWLARETGRSHPHRQRQRTDARTLERRRRDRPRQRAGTRAFGPTSPTRCRPRQPRGPTRRRHDPHPDVQRPREPRLRRGRPRRYRHHDPALPQPPRRCRARQPCGVVASQWRRAQGATTQAHWLCGEEEDAAIGVTGRHNAAVVAWHGTRPTAKAGRPASPTTAGSTGPPPPATPSGPNATKDEEPDPRPRRREGMTDRGVPTTGQGQTRGTQSGTPE